MGTRFARWTIAVLAAGAAGGLADAGEAAASAEPVMPGIHWNAADGRLFTAVPPAVAAWLAGAIDDPDGAFEAWHARYLDQSRTPGFSAAIAELERLVKAAGGSERRTSLEVETSLIPRLLGDRPDLRRGLEGTAHPLVSGGGADECYRIQYGALYCEMGIGWFCFRWGCNLDSSARECQVITPIICPPDANGMVGWIDDPELPLQLP
jgi:hypothetical protein